MCKKYWWSKSEIHNIFEQSLRNRKVSKKYLDKKFKKIGESKWANIFRWFRFATESRKLFYAVMCKIPRHIPPPPPPPPLGRPCAVSLLTRGADRSRRHEARKQPDQSEPTSPCSQPMGGGLGGSIQAHWLPKTFDKPGGDRQQAGTPAQTTERTSEFSSLYTLCFSLSLSLSRIIASQSYALLDTYNYF